MPRPLGFWMAVALVMGNMIGSGIFLLPSSLAPYGGISLAGWFTSAAGAIMLALVFARLSAARPAAGGPYAYTREAFGDLAGFLVAWGYWISVWTSLGALAVALVGYLTPFVPALNSSPISAAALAIVAVWVLVGVNIAGVRTAGHVQAITTVLKLLPLAFVGIAGLFFFEPADLAINRTARDAITQIPAVAALTLWAFLGLESATVPAGSIEDPARTIPRATVVGTSLAALVYIVSTVGVMSVLNGSALAGSSAPFADAAATIGGPWAGGAIAIGAAISCFGTLNGWTLVAGQLPLAIARDGLFPRIFARTSSRGTPTAGLVIAGSLVTVLVCFNYTRGLVDLFTFLILLSTLNTLVPYVFCSLAIVVLGDGRRYPRLSASMTTVAALAFVYAVWAIGGSGRDTVYWGFLLLVCGLPVYVAITRPRRTPSA